MHDIRWIRENAEAFDKALGRRNLTDEERKEFSSQNIISIDELRRGRIRVLETWQARRNAASKAIGQAKAKKDESKVQELMAEVALCKDSISNLEGEEKQSIEQLASLLARIPNLPLDEVPKGADETGNVEHHRFGEKREYAFAPNQHFVLGEALGQMDFEIAAKLSGARFVVLRKGLARLERALGQFFLDVHTSEPHDYTEVSPPLLVLDNVMFGTAQLPKFENDQFSTVPRHTLQKERMDVLNRALAELRDRNLKDGSLVEELEEQIFYETEIESERLWLIPTAEVPLTNLVRESIVDEAQLPMRFTACTPCFRAEAGAAGRDTRGMIRQHQFTKVELVSITTPETSKDEHERMLSCAEEVLRRLDLHYRVVTLCAGDMGFASQKTYDIEVWLPGQNTYREISSCSMCGEFQARRMNARYKNKEGRNVPVHTLNGSG